MGAFQKTKYLFLTAPLLTWILYLGLDQSILYPHGFVSFWSGKRLQLFLINSAIVLPVLALGAVLLRRKVLHFVVFLALFGGFSIATALKVKATGMPLLPQDLTLVRNISFLFVYLTPSAWLFLGLMALGVGLSVRPFFVLNSAESEPLRWRPLLVCSLPGVILMSLILGWEVYPLVPTLRSGIWKAKPNYWDQAQNYRDNGPVLAFLYNLKSLYVQPPASYGRSEVYDALRISSASAVRSSEGVQPALNGGGGVRDPDEKPDVVVVMVESLFDPLTLPGLRFSRDPMPRLRALIERFPHGKVVVPLFGGGTANTEFEFLTGMSTSYFPQGTVPYEHYVKQTVSALPTVFHRHGYLNYAVHNGMRSFWRRNEVYPDLGFDRFFSIEDLSAPGAGESWDDSILTRKVGEILDSRDQAPLFVFGVTLAMHGPYESTHAVKIPVTVDSSLPEGINREISNYASALAATDQELGKLAEKILRRKRKALLLIFGDHLPGLGNSGSAYSSTGFVGARPGDDFNFRAGDYSKLHPQDYVKLHETPFIMVSNYGIAAPMPEVVGANCLGRVALDSAGLDIHSRFWRFVSEFCARKPYLVNSTREAHEGLEKSYGLLIYDRLLGLGFSNGLQDP